MVRGAYMSLQRSAPLRAHRRRRRRVRACSGPVVEAAPSGHRPEGAGRRVRRRPLSTTLATLRSLPRWPLVALIVIVAAGGALRFHAAAHPNGHQSEDEQAYAKIARSLVFHKTYGTRDQVDAVHWPPGAPVMFAIAHRLNPKPRPEGRWDVPGAYAWQAAVGTLTILAAFWLALLLAGPRLGPVAGVVGAAAVAFYPPLIAASGELLSEPLGALLLTSATAATVRYLQVRTTGWGIAAGLLLAATILTRADLILVPLIALVVIALVARREANERSWSAVARACLPVAAALIALLAPWTVFASVQAGRFVPLSSGGMSNLWVGTYLPGDGSIFGSKRALADEVKRRYPRLADRQPWQIPHVHVLRTVAARHPELDQEAALRREALANLRDYALGQPLDFAAMMARKSWRLWGHYTRGTRKAGEAAYHPATRALHLAIVFAGLVGLLAGAALRPRAGLWLIAAVLAYLTLLNAILVSEARHNLTSMPLVAVVGPVGIALALSALRAGDRTRLRPRARRERSADTR